MSTTTFKPTTQRSFITYFERKYHVPTKVVVPDHLIVVEVNGEPKVQVTDHDPKSPTFGFRMLYTLQEAADMGIVKHFDITNPH